MTEPSEKVEESIREQHYSQIREKTDQFKAANAEFLSSREETNGLKRRSDKINAELIELISRGPDPQKLIPFSEKENWRPRNISDLALTDGLTNKLEEAGLTTLGSLQDYWRDGKFLSDIKGIGE